MANIKHLLAKAMEYHQFGELDKAKTCALDALKIQPTNAEVLHLLGILMAQSGDPESALDWLKQALEQAPNEVLFHGSLGNVLQMLKRYSEAEEQYLAALRLAPNSAEIHNNLANCLRKQGKLPQALDHYAKAVNIQPDYSDAHFNLGILLLQQGNLLEATKEFRNVIKLAPEHIKARKQLADLYLQQNKHKQAYHHYQEILRLQPSHLDALNNIGVNLLKLKQDEEALQYFTKVLAIDENHVEARNNLAALYLHNGRFENAARHYEILLKTKPQDTEVNYNLAVAKMALGKLEEAIAHLQTVLQIEPKRVDALCNLANIYLKLNLRDKAIDYYQRAQAISPEEPISNYMLSALQQTQNQSIAPPDYIKNLFDNYAGYYDKHVNEVLQYDAPLLLRQAILAVSPPDMIYHRALDLGCGTGLSGQTLHDVANHVTGVDLSSKMLEIARTKDIYDELINGDIAEVLQKLSKKFDLIVAADVFVYIGELAEIFENCARILEKNGLFAFTVEALIADEPYSLQISGRFAHAKNYLLSLAENNNLTVETFQDIIPRYQDNQPVKGYLVILRKC